MMCLQPANLKMRTTKTVMYMDCTMSPTVLVHSEVQYV